MKKIILIIISLVIFIECSNKRTIPTVANIYNTPMYSATISCTPTQTNCITIPSPTITTTNINNIVITESLTNTITETGTYTITNTITSTKTNTYTFTITYTATITNTIVPGKVWYTIPVLTPNSFPAPRTRHVSLVFNNKIWIIGGEVNVFTPSCGKTYGADVNYSSDGINWFSSLLDFAPFGPRDSHSGAVFNGKMWIIGGMNYLGEVNNDIWNSSDGITWNKVIPSSGPFVKRYTQKSFVFNNKLWVIGGSDAYGNILNDVHNSEDGVTWNTVTTNAQFRPRVSFGCVVYNNYIWIIGGSSSVGMLNDVWYSSDGLNWIQATPSANFTPMSDFATAVYNNKIYLIGGAVINTNGYSISTSKVYTSNDGINWDLISSTGYGSIAGATAEVLNNKLWLLCGTALSGDITIPCPASKYIYWTP